MRKRLNRFLLALVATAFFVAPSLGFAQANPCAAKAKNPCAAKNPCTAQNPCAAKTEKKAEKGKKAKADKGKKGAENPCAANPCAQKKY